MEIHIFKHTTACAPFVKPVQTDNYFITLLDEPLWALIKLFLDL